MKIPPEDLTTIRSLLNCVPAPPDPKKPFWSMMLWGSCQLWVEEWGDGVYGWPTLGSHPWQPDEPFLEFVGADDGWRAVATIAYAILRHKRDTPRLSEACPISLVHRCHPTPARTVLCHGATAAR